jgi:hypothetical protein
MAHPRSSDTDLVVPKRTVRYCIQCGRDISDALLCDTPDCGSIPNFYREVPGPEQRKKAPPRRRGGSHPSATRPSGSSDGGRRTVPVLLESRAEAVAVLLGVDSPNRILIFPGRNDVGATKPAQAILDVPEVSSRHAVIDCARDSRGGWEVTVTDCGSMNGTYVNKKRIVTARLKSGDLVRFAVVDFEFRLIPGNDSRKTLST